MSARLCREAVEAAVSAGASYADARVVKSQWESVRTWNERIDGVDRGERVGIGVRARFLGGWGQAATTELSPGAAFGVGRRAVELADAAALLLPHTAPLAGIDPVDSHWATPVETDPFEVPVEEKFERLVLTVRAARRAGPLVGMAGHISASRQFVTLATSDGTFVTQERVVTGVGCRVFAASGPILRVRSFPQALGGWYATGGYEQIEALDLLALAESAGVEAIQLLDADPCPPTRLATVLSGSAVAALLYETCRRAAHADALVEPERLDDPSGPVHLAEASRQPLAPLLHVQDDPTLPLGLGSYGFDDEGVPARPTTLVTAGRWQGLLTDRQQAGRLALPPTGNARAGDFDRAPGIHPSNLVLTAGSWSLDDLLEDTPDGLFLDTPTRLSNGETGQRLRGRFEIGWLIRDGRPAAPVRAPVIDVDPGCVWQRCDAVCAEPHRRLWSLGGAREGHPPMPIASGQSTVPCRLIDVRTASPTAEELEP